MNERIKDLISEATGHTWSVYEINGMRTFGERVEFFDKEKFAELIIRECASIAGKAEYSDTWLEPVEDAIKQHFGVEE